MHPTVDEQLAGAGRLLDLVAADPGPSPDSGEALANARRLLTKVSRSWAELLPFYRADNVALTTLLDHVAPGAGADGAPDDHSVDQYDVRAVAERNTVLRERLSQALAALPDSPAGADARAEIAEYLTGRVAADPS